MVEFLKNIWTVISSLLHMVWNLISTMLRLVALLPAITSQISVYALYLPALMATVLVVGVSILILWKFLGR